MIGDAAAADGTVLLEQRANYLRYAILNDREFMQGVQEGFEQAQRGETMTLAELDQLMATWE